ncbi:MAG TPA: GNAT family N-acetyltransferase [Trueperaceae bacterium]|nr:GNAT family N-acetyltransferase [Trueperaceae bacterium]
MSVPDDVRVLTEGDFDALVANLSVAFGEVSSGAEERVLEHIRAQLPNTLGSFEHGRLASSALMYPFEMYVGGTRQPVGGLASVATEPWARRRGHVARLLRAWFERLHEAGVGWCAEHPFDPRFYTRYGFQSLPNGRTLEVAPAAFDAGPPPDAERLTGTDLAPLKRIHEAFASRYSFAPTRDDAARDGWWRVARPWTGGDRHAYLLEDAYVVFARFDDTGGPLDVTDLAWSTPAGRRRLGRFLRAFDGQFPRIRLHLPPGDALLLDHQARNAVQTPLLQVRIVDVAACLAPLAAPRASRWRLAVDDADCPWNQGVFDVQLGPEGCALTPAGGAADVRLDVGALAALLGAGAHPEALLADGRAEGDAHALHALGELMRAQPPFQARADGF